MLDLKQEEYKKYLLISAKPAPNGGMHLGHVSGPYLRQDMLKRHFQARGADVAVICGTDPVDSFIALRAAQTADQSSDVANKYYNVIRDDLTSLGITFDAFINPLSDEWSQLYLSHYDEVVSEANKQAKVKEKQKPFPFDVESKAPCSGAWIVGNCPDCSKPVSGYFCEDCGAHFEPAEIDSAQHRESNIAIQFEPNSDLFFEIENPENLVQKLAACGVQKGELEIVSRQFQKKRLDIRLTEPSEWGISYNDDPKKKFFGHGLLYSYCRLLGEVYKLKKGAEINPFDSASDVISVNLFGIDNVASHMINIQAIGEEIVGWKGFDHFVVNRFYLLEGKKFSTSARHVIWAQDLIHKSKLTADGVRFVVSATSPTYQQQDLTVKKFLHWYNDVYIQEVIGSVLPVANQLLGYSCSSSMDSKFKSSMESLLEENAELYNFHDFDPMKLVHLLKKLLTMMPAASQEQQYWWLKTVSLVLYPIMPSLALDLWQHIGEEHSPSLKQFSRTTTVNNKTLEHIVAPTHLKNLAKSLPEILINEYKETEHVK